MDDQLEIPAPFWSFLFFLPVIPFIAICRPHKNIFESIRLPPRGSDRGRSFLQSNGLQNFWLPKFCPLRAGLVPLFRSDILGRWSLLRSLPLFFPLTPFPQELRNFFFSGLLVSLLYLPSHAWQRPRGYAFLCLPILSVMDQMLEC